MPTLAGKGEADAKGEVDAKGIDSVATGAEDSAIDEDDILTETETKQILTCFGFRFTSFKILKKVFNFGGETYGFPSNPFLLSQLGFYVFSC
jgi:hypothetical protein